MTGHKGSRGALSSPAEWQEALPSKAFVLISRIPILGCESGREIVHETLVFDLPNPLCES